MPRKFDCYAPSCYLVQWSLPRRPAHLRQTLLGSQVLTSDGALLHPLSLLLMPLLLMLLLLLLHSSAAVERIEERAVVVWEDRELRSRPMMELRGQLRQLDAVDGRHARHHPAVGAQRPADPVRRDGSGSDPLVSSSA